MKTSMLFLTAMLGAGTLSAQSVRNANEANQNAKARSVNKAQLERDAQELAEFNTKIAQLDAALTDRDKSTAAEVKKLLLADMEREIRQSERKIEQDLREVGQSKAEANSSERELRRSQAKRIRRGGDGAGVRDDRRDRADDCRDTQDDKNDLAAQRVRTARQKEILVSIEAYAFDFEVSGKEKVLAQMALVREFAATMEADLAATRMEITEDQRESQEDRRERREDRRDRR